MTDDLEDARQWRDSVQTRLTRLETGQDEPRTKLERVHVGVEAIAMRLGW